MQKLIAFANSDNAIIILDLLKMCFIAFFAFSVVAHMWPYFYGSDTSLYGTTAINLVNGSWGIHNDLLKTGLWEFVPLPFTKTIQNDAVPLGGLGMHGLSALSYLLAGHYGLFYLVPVFTILLIIALDQICLKLFGRFVAFVSVILTGTSYWLFGYGIQLLSETIFAFFFLIGIYFLIKFYRDHKASSIFLCSSFFVVASFLRTNGIISLPLEILVMLWILFSPILQNKPNLTTIISSSKFLFTQNKSYFKIILFMSIPWIFFALVGGIYNYYFFGDPMQSPYEGRPYSELEWSLSHALENLNADIFNWIEYFASFLLPEKLFSLVSGGSGFLDVTPWNLLWIGIFSVGVLFFAIIISFFTKEKRAEIIILSLFVLAVLVFFALGQMSRIPSIEQYTPRELIISFPTDLIRYMVPMFPIFYIIFGFILYRIWKINSSSISKFPVKKIVQGLKLGFLSFVILFLFTSFYDSYIFTELKKESITDPQKEIAKHYPINRELPEKSVIVSFEPYQTLEYGLIPFYPFWGFNFLRIEIEPYSIPQEPISTIKKLIGSVDEKASGTKSPLDELQNYQVFTFKNHRRLDTSYYHYLELNHGIILKDYSTSFCKMILVESNSNNTQSKGDLNCY